MKSHTNLKIIPEFSVKNSNRYYFQVAKSPRSTLTWFQSCPPWLTMAVMEIFVSLQFDDSELVLLRGVRMAELAVRMELEPEAASWLAAASQARLFNRSGKFVEELEVVAEESSRGLSLVAAGERTGKKISTRWVPGEYQYAASSSKKIKFTQKQQNCFKNDFSVENCPVQVNFPLTA